MQRQASFELLIFDFDGTLASSLDGITACMGTALQRFGYAPPTAAQVQRTVGLTLEESVLRLTDFDCPQSTLHEIVRTYRALHATEAAPRIVLFDHAADVLRAVTAAGLKAALVSNKSSAALLQLLDQLGIRRYFDLVLGADRVQHPKPSAMLFERHIATHFPTHPPDRVLVIGDTESDLRFAANIGAHSCWAAYGYGDADACEALGPTFRVSALRELPGLCGVTIAPQDAGVPGQPSLRRYEGFSG